MSVKYSDRVKELEQIISKLQNCEDVDEAVELFEKGSQHILECEKRIQEAKGKYEEIKQTDIKS